VPSESDGSDSAGNGRAEVVRTWRSFINLVAFLFGVVPGVAALAGWSSGAGEIALRVIAAVSLLFLLVRLTHAFLVVGNRRLRSQVVALSGRLEEAERAMADYVGAIERIIDRQAALHEERVEILTREYVNGPETMRLRRSE
jgi:hypothetical protein